MKRFTKFIAVAIMFTLCLGYMFTIPFGKKKDVYAASDSVGSVLTIKGLKSTAEIDEELEIPKGSSTSAVNVTIKNPRGKVVTDYVRETDTSIVIKPTMLGYYTVEYSVADGITRSKIYSIEVKGTKPTLEFISNAKTYLPETIYDAKTVVLPTPTVKLKDNTVVEDVNMLIRDGSHAETNTTGASVVWVSAQDPNYNTVNLYRDENENIIFTATKDVNQKYTYGTYTITYFFQASNGLTITKYAQVEVEKDYKENVVDKIDMTFVWENGKSMPTSAVLGEELQLPMPVAQDKAKNNQKMQAHVTVKVDFIPNGNLSSEWKPYEVNQQTLTFVPQDKTVNGGYYRIEYKVENYFGVDTQTSVYTLKNVTDTVKPDVYLVEDYSLEDANQGNVDTTKNLSYMIPNKVIASSDNAIVLPAIYGVDNYAKFEGLELRRIWINGTNQTRLDKKDADNKYITNESLTLSYDDTELNETVRNCLKTPGTYQVRYEVYDGANTNRTLTFDVVVLERNFTDSVAPRITMPSISKVGFTGDTITFKAPTVVDYASENLQEVEIDTRNVKVEVGYYAGSNYNTFLTAFQSGADISSYIESGEFNYINTLEDDNNYYSFQIPSNATYSELKIVVRAIDNAKYGAPNNVIAENNIAVKDYTLRVVTKDANTDAPSFDISQISDVMLSAGQNETINIESVTADKTFTFTGINQDFTEIYVNVYDPNGNLVDVRGASTNVSADASQISVKGGHFKSSKDGEYTITLTATDISGNSTVVAYKYLINDTIAPVIEVGNIPATVTVGQEITLPDAVMIDNGEVKENLAQNKIDFTGFDNPAYTFNHATNIFVAKEVGTYTFVYRANDGVNEDVEVVKHITATANTNEKDKLAFNDASWNSTAKLTPIIENEVETGKYEKIKIPYLTVENAVGGIKTNSYTVKVKAPNGQDISVTELDEELYFGEFEPTAKDGEYTITYSVEDMAGNKETLTKALRVGDLVKPELEIKNQQTNLPTSAKLNGTLEILASDITYTDNSGSDGLTLTITMKKASGTETLSKKDGKYSYTFKEAGTYTLTYTVTDKAGNKAVKSQEIKVSAEGAQENVVTSVMIGVIIALVVVLTAGIAIFFIVNNKKKKSAKEANKARAKNLE